MIDIKLYSFSNINRCRDGGHKSYAVFSGTYKQWHSVGILEEIGQGYKETNAILVYYYYCLYFSTNYGTMVAYSFKTIYNKHTMTDKYQNILYSEKNLKITLYSTD